MQSSKSPVGSNEEFAEVLRSSWIRRLHLKPTSSILKNKENPPPIAVNSPPSNGSLTCNQTAISREESRTQSSNFNAPTTPLPQQDNPSMKLDTIKCSFPGFGPFQLKNRPTVSDKDTVLGEDEDHLIDSCPEDQEENADTKNLSSFSERSSADDRRGTPLSPFFRYWPDSKKNQGLRKSTPTEELNKYGTSPNASSIGGSNCHENCDNNGAASRILKDHQQNVVLSQLERSVSINPNETGKASFWHMNRFRKTEVLSSMLHPCKSNTKRKSTNSFDELACAKFRKLGHQD